MFATVIKNQIKLNHEYTLWIHRLTNREKEEREHKRKLLQIAKEHEKARELERVQRYHMPDSKKGQKGTELRTRELNAYT